MPIADDWSYNYAAKVLSHIDGVLSYGSGSGTQPAVDQYIIGATSGAIGKILARTGTVTTGTFTLTNVIGRFANGETLDQLSTIDFDNIGNGGFKVGDTIVDQVTGTMDVKFIEYNIDGTVGHGTAYGNNMSVFTNDSQIDISGGQTAVAIADGVGVDNDTAFDTTASATLAVPGTANTNNSVIIHYDGGTIAIPEDAHIADTSGPTGAEGYAQRVIGSITKGSIYVVDSDTTGAGWVDNNTLYVHDVVYYDTLVSGKVFSAGDIIKAVNGASPDAVGRVLAVIDDGDNTGKLILAGMSGTWDNDNEIHAKQPDDTYVKYAEVEDAQNDYLAVATMNIPSALGGVRDEQRTDQGGIYAAGSLNIVRSYNAFYSLTQDLYDELSALDDLPPLEGNVKDQLYTELNDYIIPDLSKRFLEKGSSKDSGNNNIFLNLQSAGVVADIGDHGFFYDSSNPTPQPDMYLEQDGKVKRQDWLEGHVDILVKVKTSTDPAYINPNVEALGQLIDSGKVVLHLRPYRRTYDSAELTVPGGGQKRIFISNAADDNNTTGQYTAAYQTGVGTPFTVGEGFTTSGGKRGVITSSDSGATGNITYVLKSSTNFVDTNSITGSVSGATADINGAPTNLVAGYGTDIRVMTVDSRFTGGTTAVATFIIGEQVNQAGGGAYIGYILEDDAGNLYTQDVSGTRANAQQITGQTSGATNTPTGNADYTTAPKDIGGGVGDKNYTAVSALDITGISAQTVLKSYEWWKFLLRKESVLIQGGPGSTSGVEGHIYRYLVSTFAEVRGASQYGSKAGDLVQGAQGMFIQDMAAADLQNIKLRDNLGDPYSPPNVQSMIFSNLIVGARVAVYRTATEGVEDIQRTEFKVGAVGTGNNQAGDTHILLAAQDRTVSPLPYDVPDTGVVRVLDPNDTGDYLRFPYSSVNRTTNIFTLTSGTIGDVTGAEDLVLNDNSHVVPIEKESSGTSVSNTLQFIGNFYYYAVARIKGKQPFKTTGTFGSGGTNIGAVLNPDNVVNLP